jgi:putative hydrolase of the HAD superfamily
MRAVTFDCWGTLIYERDTTAGYGARVEVVLAAAEKARARANQQTAREALDVAWTRHWALWQEGVGSGVAQIAAWALAELDVRAPTAIDDLAHDLAHVALDLEVAPLDGARVTLEHLAERGVRRALICDTGFSPGSVVRQLLERAGLLALLEVQVFSDEAGVPKPHADVFHAALEPFGIDPCDAVHVGDLRHTDIRGARDVGMGTVRINDHHDDQSALPDADAVAQSHAELRSILGIG